MFEFFDNIAPENAEQISQTRADKIKASVLSRIEEDKPMKKHFSIKPFLIAAAVAVTGAVSVVTANAATDGAIINNAKKHFFFTFGDNECSGTVTYYETEDGEKTTMVEIDLPEDGTFDGTNFSIMNDNTGYYIVNEDGESDLILTSEPVAVMAPDHHVDTE